LMDAISLYNLHKGTDFMNLKKPVSMAITA
jgi:hypothetical protein